ncbi:MAG: hypothetical protein K6U09_03090 [Acidobacteriia bacterium]|nr:hypothetical protein [Terriglobia bacterium]
MRWPVAADGSAMMLTHFEAMLLFALVTSVALGVLSRRGTAARLWYTAGVFLAFVGIAIAVAWLMYLAVE